MTTIALRDGRMAGDAKSSPSPGHNSRGSVTTKTREINGWLVGMAGCFSLSETAAHRLEATLTQRKPPPAVLLDLSEVVRGPDAEDLFMLLWHPVHGAYHCEMTSNGRMVACPVHGDFFAIGSGSQLAIAAMMAGAGPERAVEIACELDNNSGKPVTSIAL